MSEPNVSTGVDEGGLRERLPHTSEAQCNASSSEGAQDAIRSLSEKEANRDRDEKEKRTYGRTPSGTGAYAKECACWRVDKRTVRVQ